MIKITKNWHNLLKSEFEKEYFKKLQTFLKEEYLLQTIYPKIENIFNALNFCKYDDIKVVVIGQDPYHQQNQAFGLCFAVQDGVALPPSLKNIFKEIESDLNIKCKSSGNLGRWAVQGVLLLNTVLTVRQNLPNSHKNKGWEIFTQEIIKLVNQKNEQVIFVLWGNNAKVFAPLIDKDKHIILSAPHPSPLSAYNGFFGCKHFSKINEILIKNKKTPINWE
ncbi:MAG: uracil-DNA glycosylase [Clostridia bacterium]|nr:uracil-DNA glycosylase [Clostridia bacterium]